ncbi:MAG: hypothetical protein ABSH48_04820 [Verrucomicrobiota bacterium]
MTFAKKKGDGMIVLEQKPDLEIRSEGEADLVVEPADISFHDLAAGSVMIRVKIHNEGDGRSRPTFLRLESAPLGAFVPWRPLAVLPVPALEPGESLELSREVPRLRPPALGSFDRLPPTTLLTAVNAAPDEPSRPATGLTTMLDLLRGRDAARPNNKSAAGTEPALAPDLWDLVGREQPHWAGNINVFIGARAVERHLARALRIYPGRPNLAVFLVGERGLRDAYAFDVSGLAPEWQAVLYDATNARTLAAGSVGTPVPETQWVEGAGALMMMLAVRPPAGCAQGRVAVQVRRRSDEKTAVVEFDLDPAAQGAGCYAM